MTVGGLDDGGRAVAVEGDVEHGAGGGERVTQLAGVDVEGDGVLAAAVQHAGNAALAAQTARGAGTFGGAHASVELGGRGLGHGTDDGSGTWAPPARC